MSVKIGINGFGRIGRLVFRAGLDRDNIEFTAINDPYLDSDYMVYLLKHDSAHGTLQRRVESKAGYLIVDGKKLCCLQGKRSGRHPLGICRG